MSGNAFITSLVKGGYVFVSVCLFVDNIAQKVLNGFG